MDTPTHLLPRNGAISAKVKAPSVGVSSLVTGDST